LEDEPYLLYKTTKGIPVLTLISRTLGKGVVMVRLKIVRQFIFILLGIKLRGHEKTKTQGQNQQKNHKLDKNIKKTNSAQKKTETHTQQM